MRSPRWVATSRRAICLRSRWWSIVSTRCCVSVPSRRTAKAARRSATANRTVPARSRSETWSVCPEAPTCQGEVVGIRDGAARRLLGLEHLVGDPVPLAVRGRLFLGIEEQAQLLLHIA